MTEPQPPAWWQPPPDPVPQIRPYHQPSHYLPERPHYRERRPVRWWTVVLGLTGSAIWYALVAIASWSSTTSLLVGLAIAMTLASVATWLLAWRGDVGLSVGIGIMIGFTLALTVFLAGYYPLMTPS